MFKQAIKTLKRQVHVKNIAADLQIQPRLDYNQLAKRAAIIELNSIQRNYPKVDMTHFTSLNQRRLDLYNELKSLRSKRNELSVAVQKADSSSRSGIVSESKQVKQDIKSKEQTLKQIETELFNKAWLIPNDTHPDAPIGPEENATIIKTVGTKRVPEKGETLLDHVTLSHQLDILDLDQAAVASGSSFYYLQGMGAFLELALVQYAMHKAASKGFLSMLTPDIVKTQLAYGCGFQPRTNESSQIYNITTSEEEDSVGLCLAGTAEIPLAGKFANRLLNETELPQRVVGFGHAFRVEAGGRGTETKGLYRVHQFSKVELFAVTTAEQSESMMDEIRSLQEEMFTELGLTFRILDMPTEELGASAYRKYDMEAWMPGRGKWGEISSTSNCTDYQSRRLSIRYRPQYQTDQNTLFCHTLNGTAIAVPRIIIAILETFQRPDGSVEIPKVLRKWLPGEPSLISPQ
ncbi:seryl-tRNA synthetase [Backusella circina FSU 941]|nr:seryl-tRNA synthetase [Backusella circina FSU 941]